MFETRFSAVSARRTRAPWMRTAAFAALIVGIALATAAVGLAAARSPVPAGIVPVAEAAQDRRERGSGPLRAWREGRSRRPQADRFARDDFGRWGRRLAEELELTDEQRDGLRDAIREVGDARRDSRRAIADAQRAFRRAAADPDRTGDEIRALGEALGRAQADAAVARRGERERILAVLTPEQRERASELREREGDRRERRMRRGSRSR